VKADIKEETRELITWLYRLAAVYNKWFQISGERLLWQARYLEWRKIGIVCICNRVCLEPVYSDPVNLIVQYQSGASYLNYSGSSGINPQGGRYHRAYANNTPTTGIWFLRRRPAHDLLYKNNDANPKQLVAFARYENRLDLNFICSG